MRRSLILVLLALLMGFGVVLNVSAQVTAVRTLPYDMYWPDQKQLVAIEVTGDAGPITVVETPPVGWKTEAINPKAGMTFANGVITWDFTAFDGSQIFQYHITPPAGTNGEVVYSGMIGTIPIGGMSTQTLAKPEPLGLFEDHRDIMEVLEYPNEAAYDPQNGEYRIHAMGDFHFVYSQFTGDFTLKAKVAAENRSDTAPAFLLVVDDLRGPIGASGSKVAFYSAIITNRGGGYAGWDMGTGEGGKFTSPINASLSDGVRIERHGNTLRMYYFDTTTQAWVHHHQIDITFTDPVYVGLAGRSSSPGFYSTDMFTEVELTQFTSSVTGWELFN
ncbi:MAG TPA: hypothetical protein PK360_00770 [bacterium]|nr:hypothetical protein [bacterium]